MHVDMYCLVKKEEAIFFHQPHEISCKSGSIEWTKIDQMVAMTINE